MLTKILATTALATVLSLAAHAQNTTDSETAPAEPAETEAPETTTDDAPEADPEAEADPAAEPTTEGEVTEGTTAEGAIGEETDADAPDAEADPAAEETMTEEPAAEEAVEEGAMETEEAVEEGAAETEEAVEEGAMETEEAVEEVVEPETEAAEEPAVEETAEEEVADAPEDTGPMMDESLVTEGFTIVDLTTLSVEGLVGADITNMEDDTIATVDDVIMSTDGQVESLVAKFGGFLGFGSNTVLLTLDEIAIVQDAEQNVAVRTLLTPEDLEGRPEYEAG